MRTSCSSSSSSSSSSSITSTNPASSHPSTIHDLKQRLEESLARTETNLTEESLEIIAELEALNPTPNPATRHDLWAGPFQMLNSSMNNVLYRGAQVTLGRATFNAFKPNSLAITMEEVYNDVCVRRPDAYDVVIPFTIAEQGLPPLKGLLLNEARVSQGGETRLNVEFLSSTLLPRDSTIDLEAWMGVFGRENEMDERGVCRVELPPAKGWLEVTYLDDDYRITHGNFGTIVVVKRLESPAVSPTL